jgi:hypothetical protein
MAKSITLIYGRESFTKEINDGATIADVATAANLSFLGAPKDNIRFTVNGDNVGSSYFLEDGDDVYIEQAAHTKA